jgi:hypothetical protein
MVREATRTGRGKKMLREGEFFVIDYLANDKG